MSKNLENCDSSSSYEVSEYCVFGDEASSKVQDLARSVCKSSNSTLMRKLRNMSQVPGINSIPNGDEEINPRLDPDSDEFDSKFWVKNLRKLYNSDPSFYKRSSLGVAFKDLRAYGIATDADYQATFTNGVDLEHLFSHISPVGSTNYREWSSKGYQS